MTKSNTRVPCSDATRSALKAAKRGGETYDELMRKMLKQYDPGAAQTSMD